MHRTLMMGVAALLTPRKYLRKRTSLSSRGRRSRRDDDTRTHPTGRAGEPTTAKAAESDADDVFRGRGAVSVDCQPVDEVTNEIAKDIVANARTAGVL